MARHLYDLIVLIDPNAPEERRSAVVSEVEQMISSGGELVGAHDWGLRRMAYEIDHRPEAEYRLYQFNGGQPAAREPAPQPGGSWTACCASGVIRTHARLTPAATPARAGPPA